MSLDLPAIRDAAGTPATASSVQYADPTGAQLGPRTPVRTLGQNEFFKLIAAQFSHQDPLNPQKDTDFIAQMAQFNTLEQTRLMQSDIAGLRTQFSESQASLLLGQIVNIKDPTSGNTVQGLVSEVRNNSGRSQVVVNGTPYDFSAVQSVQLDAQGVPTAPLPFAATGEPVVGPVYRP